MEHKNTSEALQQLGPSVDQIIEKVAQTLRTGGDCTIPGVGVVTHDTMPMFCAALRYVAPQTSKRDVAISLLSKGHTAQEVCDSTGVTLRYLRRQGLLPADRCVSPARKRKDELRDRILEVYAECQSQRHTAAKVGCSMYLVKRHLLEAGAKITHPRGRPLAKKISEQDGDFEKVVMAYRKVGKVAPVAREFGITPYYARRILEDAGEV